MTHTEFTAIVWPYMVESFPSIKSKLTNEFPEVASREGQVTRGAIVSRWRGVLGDFTADEVKAACDELLRTDWQAPYALEEYPVSIRATVSKMRQAKVDRTYRQPGKVVNGEVVFRCKFGCQDSGMLMVWHPDAHKAARKQPDEFIAGKILSYTCVVPCACHAGDKMMHFDPKGKHRYVPDDARAVKVPEFGSMPREAMRRQLVAILAERDASGPRWQGQIEYADERGFPT